MPMPLEIVGLGKPEVQFVWDEGEEDIWPARLLRILCTCAMCQSEATGERILDPDGVPRDIAVTDMRLVGNYGVNIHFSDGHSTGIYRFAKLRETKPPLFAVAGGPPAASAAAPESSESAGSEDASSAPDGGKGDPPA